MQTGVFPAKKWSAFTFTDPQVQARLKNVELVQINVTDGTPDDAALLKRFKLFGPPGILFLTGRESRFQTSKSLATSIKETSSRYWTQSCSDNRLITGLPV